MHRHRALQSLFPEGFYLGGEVPSRLDSGLLLKVKREGLQKLL
jgi:hypothetical protein